MRSTTLLIFTWEVNGLLIFTYGSLRMLLRVAARSRNRCAMLTLPAFYGSLIKGRRDVPDFAVFFGAADATVRCRRVPGPHAAAWSWSRSAACSATRGSQLF
jgi:hypothetical protein